jgi:hypothetical protein
MRERSKMVGKNMNTHAETKKKRVAGKRREKVVAF